MPGCTGTDEVESEVSHDDVSVHEDNLHEWLHIDDEEIGEESQPNILELVDKCLKQAKALKSARMVNMIMQLTPVAQFVKLREKYCCHGRSKTPSVSASLAITRRMGKGPYFAHQIQKNDHHLLHFHQLPPCKDGAYCGQATLLDNKSVVHAICRYLAAKALGTITTLDLCHHVNKVILPGLNLSGNSQISERTAHSWLKKLGYQCKDVQKGLYVDGHERPDVIKAREEFLSKIQKYER